MRETENLTGMSLAAIAFALLTAVDTSFKLIAASGHPAWQILFINGWCALIPIMLYAGISGGLHQLSTTRLPQHLVRGTASVMSAFAAIFAYERLPLTDYYAIVFAGPLLVTALSALWLSEKISAARGMAIAAGLLGVLVVADPFTMHEATFSHDLWYGRFSAFISVFCYALSVIMVRRMRGHESSLSFPFYGYVCCVAISGVWWAWSAAPPLSTMEYDRLALAGMLAGASSVCLMNAYHRSPVSVVAPFQYTQIIWGAVAGWVLWHQLPSMSLIAGASIVVVSGLFVILGEMRNMRRLSDRLQI